MQTADYKKRKEKKYNEKRQEDLGFMTDERSCSRRVVCHGHNEAWMCISRLSTAALCGTWQAKLRTLAQEVL